MRRFLYSYARQRECRRLTKAKDRCSGAGLYFRLRPELRRNAFDQPQHRGPVPS